jgi:5-methylcytosine-specific restriction endonuclease McrBC GTP-binding regulatory subunit McrB
LAGISGTGKTLLPIKYAEAMGMHSLVVSIQPRWDSPQDLFGFYNYLERKYKATELARALVRMDPYKFNDLEGGNRSDRMLLVLLDEMNLARVEYYFSEFLSKLELRRGIGDELNATERNRAEIEMETGPRDEKNMNFRLWVGENVLFVGTVNEDESTQTLSDKVLDRANVLRFGKPSDDLNQVFNHEVTPQEQYLHLTEWKEWIKELPGNNDWDDNVDKWIKSINASLERIGRPFGHRVQLAMRLYVKNYPGVTVGDTHKYAFADQIEQKVIPKLRGIDLNEGRSQECLDEILNLVEELGDTDLETAFKDSKEDLSTGMFTWRGVTRSAEV